MKYMKYYRKWMKRKCLPGRSGLCKAFSKEGFSYSFFHEQMKSNADDNIDIYWFEAKLGAFDGVRQNCILLLAAENGEL